MRLVLTEYLSSLRERQELDVLVPNLLSQMGLNVFAIPLHGKAEKGIDVGAMGRIDSEEDKVYLFSIKSGDLDRREWDGRHIQALRPSLSEIIDTGIESRVPKEYAHLPVVICSCFGGRIKADVREYYEGYIKNNSSEKISFQEWNGDKLAEYIEEYLLDDALFVRKDRDYRSLLRKSLALVESPESSHHHFSQIITLLCNEYEKDEEVLTALRQLYLAIGVLNRWAKDEENIESAYLSSELTILQAWEMVKIYQNNQKKIPQQINELYFQLVHQYLLITEDFDAKLIESSMIQFGVSWLTRSNCNIDINLKLFDIVGRLALTNLWFFHCIGLVEKDKQKNLVEGFKLKNEALKNLIQQNPLLASPYSEDQTIEVMLVVLLLLKLEENKDFVCDYLDKMLYQIEYLIDSNGKYPCTYKEYQDLYHHPKNVEGYFEDATKASILYPFIQFIAQHPNLIYLYLNTGK